MRARVDKDGSSFKMSLKATIILAVVVAVIFMFAGGWIRGAITKFFNPQQELTNEVWRRFRILPRLRKRITASRNTKTVVLRS